MKETLIILCIISLISFDSVCQEEKPLYKWTYISQISPVDSLESQNKKESRVSSSTITASHSIEESRIINQRLLRKSDLEVLLNLLLSDNSLPKRLVEPDCYTPSNGLLFYDKHGGLIGFIELSIDCMNYRAIGICADWDVKLDSTDYEFLGKWFDQNFE